MSAKRRSIAMSNNNQAALDVFSKYSDFMLTDDELLAIHGGATPTGGHAGSAGSTPAPPAAPPPAPAAPPIPQVHPVTVHVEATVKADATHALDTLGDSQREIVHEGVDIIHDIHTSKSA